MLEFADVQEVSRFCEDHDVEYVAFYVPDIDGRLRNVTIPVGRFSERTIEEGVGFDASNLGFAAVHKSDMVLRPDLRAGFLDPVEPDRGVLYFFCNTLEAETFQPFDQDLRHIVDKALAALRAEGVADAAKVGVELEFFVVDELYSIMNRRETSYRVESSEMTSPPGGAELYRIFRGHGYHRAEPNDHLFDLRNEIVSAFTRLGLATKYHHHEVGSAQAEIEFELLPIEAMADATVLAKNICHRIARQHGIVITFIPKLVPDEAGNGMHVHHLLEKDGRNVFDDPDGLYHLSDTALAYIGGILEHADSLLALTNPTTNSYRRLVPGFEAPVRAVFAEGNRSAAIRIPGYVKNPRERRFEFRTMDATCNPYLAFAALMMAGLDGVRRKVDPSEAGFGPYEQNLYELSPEELAGIRAFPSSLDGALQALEADRDYLLHRDVFPEGLIEEWIRAKESDLEEMRRIPHPWEIARYYDI